MEERFYTSVSTFSTDLGTVFSAGIGMSTVADTAEVQSQIIVDRSRKDLSSEQKEKRKLAKRIIKAIQPALEDAMRKESDLCRRPFEKELRDLDILLETSISSRRDSMTGSLAENGSEDEPDGQTAEVTITERDALTKDAEPEPVKLANSDKPLTNGFHDSTIGDYGHPELEHAAENPHSNPVAISKTELSKATDCAHQLTPEDFNPTPSINNQSIPYQPTSEDVQRHTEHQKTVTTHHPAPSTASHLVPPTPPLSSGGDLHTVLSSGGIPWYMEPFDPVGTTIFEERWTGREVARGMSEELSDMDEEELDGLVDVDLDVEMDMGGIEGAEDVGVSGGGEEGNVGAAVARKKNGKVKKRWRGFR